MRKIDSDFYDTLLYKSNLELPLLHFSSVLGEVSILLDDLESTEDKSKEVLLEDEIEDKLVEEVFEMKPNVNTTLVQIKADQLLHVLEKQEAIVDQIDNLDSDERDKIKQLLKNEVFNEVMKSSNETLIANETFVNLAKQEKAIETLDINETEKLILEDKVEDSIINQTVQNELRDFNNSQKVEKLESLTQILQEFEDSADSENSGENHEMIENFIEVYNPKSINDSALEKLNKNSQFLNDLQKVNVTQNKAEIEMDLELNALEKLSEMAEGIENDSESFEKVNYLTEAKNEYFNHSDPVMIYEAANFLKPNKTITSVQDEAALLDSLMDKEFLLQQAQNLSAMEKAAIDTKLEEEVVHEILEFDYEQIDTEPTERNQIRG